MNNIRSEIQEQIRSKVRTTDLDYLNRIYFDICDPINNFLLNNDVGHE